MVCDGEGVERWWERRYVENERSTAVFGSYGSNALIEELIIVTTVFCGSTFAGLCNGSDLDECVEMFAGSRFADECLSGNCTHWLWRCGLLADLLDTF